MKLLKHFLSRWNPWNNFKMPWSDRWLCGAGVYVCVCVSALWFLYRCACALCSACSLCICMMYTIEPPHMCTRITVCTAHKAFFNKDKYAQWWPSLLAALMNSTCTWLVIADMAVFDIFFHCVQCDTDTHRHRYRVCERACVYLPNVKNKIHTIGQWESS